MLGTATDWIKYLAKNDSDGRENGSRPARDGVSWYAYCGWDPVNRVDIDGLLSVKVNGITIGNVRKDGEDNYWGPASDLVTALQTGDVKVANLKYEILKDINNTSDTRSWFEGDYKILSLVFGASTYNLSLITAVAGKSISAGDSIGKSGNTGNSSGPHLHFEMRVNDSWSNQLNPTNYLPKYS